MLGSALRPPPRSHPRVALRETPRVVVPHDPVARARQLLQACAIRHRDPAPAVVYRSRGLQPARRNGYGGALNTEHLSEKFLRERKVVRADTILRHEEPARTALFHAMPLVARGALCHLIEYGLGVPQHD